MTDCDDGIAYIGGRTEVTHTAIDQAGNKAICRYYIEVEGMLPEIYGFIRELCVTSCWADNSQHLLCRYFIALKLP
mgnify:FL=1